MSRCAIITGTVPLDEVRKESAAIQVKTDFGTISVVDRGGMFLLVRHGSSRNVPPHMIDHRANIAGLAGLGIERIIAFCSVGSLGTSMAPGELVIPDDYISLRDVPTFHDNEIRHITPTLMNPWREHVHEFLTELGIPHRNRGIYIQTRGPRLETKAEIALLAGFGDVVGMTMASEATLAQELGIQYCSVCFVDNFCHGLGGKEVIFDDLAWRSERNAGIAEKITEHLLLHEWDPTTKKDKKNDRITERIPEAV